MKSVEKESIEPPRPKKRSMAWVGYLILLIIVALSVGGWFLLQELRSRQEGLGGQLSSKDQQIIEVSRQLNAVQSEMSALHSQVASLQTESTTEESKVERLLQEQHNLLNDRINSARSELNGNLQSIQRQLNRNRGDLMIADAEYLLSIANQKLHLIGDTKSVLAALEAADQRLLDSGDPAVFKVRESLAEEIGVLKKLAPPDVVGISAKLLNIEKKVGQLPLFLPHAGVVHEHARKGSEEEQQAVTPEADSSELPKDVIDTTIEGIKDLVTIRRLERRIEAILTPEEAEGIRQILILKLEATRLALLRMDNALYKSSLDSAHEWLNAHFENSSTEVKEVKQEIEDLTNEQVSMTFPDISKSLSLLRNIEKLRLESEDQPKIISPEPVKESKPEVNGTSKPQEPEPAAPPTEPAADPGVTKEPAAGESK